MTLQQHVKQKVCWTHYDEQSRNVFGIHHETLLYQRMIAPSSVDTDRFCIRTFGQSKNLEKKIGDVGPNEEGFYFYKRRTQFEFEKEKRNGVYIMSAVNHAHAGFAKTLILLAYSKESAVNVFCCILEQLAKKDDRYGYGILDLVLKEVNGSVSLMIEFENTADHHTFLTYYMNHVYDFMPHNVEEKVTAAMRASQILGIQYSQLPADRDLEENILSWDIECLSFDEGTRMPQALRLNDRLQLIVLSHFKNTKCLKSYCLLYSRKINSELQNVLRKNVQNMYKHPVSLEMFCSEATIIEKFVFLVRNLKPTMLVSFNGSGFDTPFLLDKIKLFNLNEYSKEKITKTFMAKVFNETQRSDLFFPPCQTIDLFLEMRSQVQKDFRQGDIDEHSNFSLNYFAKKYLGDSKVEMTDNVVEICRRVADILGYGRSTSHFPAHQVKTWDPDDPTLIKFVQYCIKDTLLPVALSYRFGCIQTKRRLAEIMQTPSSNMFMGGITTQMPFRVRNEYLRRDIQVCPSFEMLCTTTTDPLFKANLIYSYYSKFAAVKRRYEGAIVVREPGIHNEVVVMDYEALYPSCIAEQNNSIETRIVRPRQMKLYKYSVQHFTRPNGEAKTMYTRIDQKGIIPEIMQGLLSERRLIKNKIKEIKRCISEENRVANSEEITTFRMYELKQLACKLAANSAYGAGAAGNTLMTCTEFSEKTTATARSMFVQINEGIKNMRFELTASVSDVVIPHKKARLDPTKVKIIYGDTDSIMICNVAKEFIPTLCSAISTSIRKAFPSGFINLEFEYFTSRMVVVRAKKYCYIHPEDVDKKNKLDQRVEAKGLKSVRGDTIPLLKEFDLGIQRRLLFSEDRDVFGILLDYCGEMVKSLTSRNLKEFVLRQKVKNINSYKNINLPHIKALQQKIDAGLIHVPGDKVSYIFVEIDGLERKVPAYMRVRYIDGESPYMETQVRKIMDSKYQLYLPHYINTIICSACNWLTNSDAHSQKRKLIDLVFDLCKSLFPIKLYRPPIKKEDFSVGTYPLPVYKKNHIYNPLLDIVIKENSANDLSS